MIHDERVLQMLEEHDEVFQISFNVFGPLSEQDTHVLGMGAKLYTDMIGGNNTCIAIVEIVDERLARATNSYIAHHFTFYSSVLLNTISLDPIMGIPYTFLQLLCCHMIF